MIEWSPFKPKTEEEADMLGSYFEYLCGIIFGRDDILRLDNNLLFRYLHRKEFYSLVPHDDNRGEDGKELRKAFLSSYRGVRKDLSLCLEGPCTFLEMLLGVAGRMAVELTNIGVYKQPNNQNQRRKIATRTEIQDCFWVLIRHLGLENIPNKALNDYEALNLTVTKVLERGYNPDGNGGLFPLKACTEDQRGVEIWYQMHSWLQENYDF